MMIQEFTHNKRGVAVRPRDCCMYLRAAKVPGCSGAICGPPLTWTLAYDPEKYIAYFVDLHEPPWAWGLVDGMHMRRRRRRFRDSWIVDSQTLGPITRYTPRRKLTIEQTAAFWHWRKFYRDWWHKLVADGYAAEFLEPTWRERLGDLLHGPRFHFDVLLRSELEIVVIHPYHPGLGTWNFLREKTVKTETPNRVDRWMLGKGREVFAYAKIAAPVQADAGFRHFYCRVWYLDWTLGINGNHVDGYHLPPNGKYHGCCDPRTIAPGLMSERIHPDNIVAEKVTLLTSYRRLAGF
jgi:hypothetical protein